MREFRDGEGIDWIVYPVNSTTRTELGSRWLPGPYQSGWLVFESGERKLRLAPIPQGWHDMTDDALRRLLTTATAVTPTAPGGMRAIGAPPPDRREDGWRRE